ncbi:MAG: Gfo/Idh/MocA family protein [Opitutales bacterium]
MALQPLRAAVLGTGNMARMHVRNFLTHPQTELVAIGSRSAAKAADFVEAVKVPGAPRVYTDFAELLEGEAGLNVVFVCLPPFAHQGEVVRAAAAGLHVFLEKPIARTVQDAEAMATAIDQAGVTSQVCYQFRFKKASQRMRALLESGEAGRPTLFEGRFWVNMAGPSWWANPDESGGQLFEQLIHLYDLGMHFCGPPAEVSARIANLCHRDDPQYRIEDTSLGQIRFQNGALGSISGSNCAIAERYIGDWRLVCEKATLHAHSTGDWREPDRTTLHFGPEQMETFTEDTDAHAAVVTDFIEAIREGRPTRAPASEGYQGVRLTRRALDSAAKGGIPLPL